MQRIILTDKNFHMAIRKAKNILQSGGVIVYPTDTCYGLGSKVDSDKAIERLKKFKGREESKPFSVIIPSLEWILERIAGLNEERKDFILSRLPGPYTFVVKIKPEFQKDLSLVLQNEKLGFRYPDNKFCQVLAERLGFPFTTTSANISGLPPAYSLEEFEHFLSERKKHLWPQLFIDAGILPKKNPSKVIDLSVYPFKVLRD